MANPSKAKGSAFEAKVKDILTKELKIEFQRVPLSGSLTWLKGDLFVPNDTASWPYCIECKHYEELDFNSLLTAKSNDIFAFWKQTTEAASTMKKKPLLIFRWNRSKDFVAWSDDLTTPSFMDIKAFDVQFKIGLLSDWLAVYKSINKLT